MSCKVREVRLRSCQIRGRLFLLSLYETECIFRKCGEGECIISKDACVYKGIYVDIKVDGDGGCFNAERCCSPCKKKKSKVE